jgi:transposase
MYRITLTTEQRIELNRRAHQQDIAPSTRDRLEMLRLSDAGYSIPNIARHLGQHQQTVRAWIKAFLNGGFEALVNKARGGKHSAFTPALQQDVRAEIAKGERTWTAAQVGAWLAQHHGVRLSVGRLRKHLRRARLSWQRTSRSLKHKQKPEEVAKKKAELATLEKGARPDG